MATLITIRNLRYEPELKARVEAAIAKAAQDILNEDPGTANHGARIVWAKDALKNSSSRAEEMLWGLVGNASIQTNGLASTDNDIQFVVNSLINTFA